MFSHNLIVYLGLVGLSGIVLIWWGKRKLLRIEDQRSQRIKEIKRFESIKTSTPIDRPSQAAKEAAVESVETRFTIIRKISFFAIVIIWLIALAFPFLKAIPATLVSALVAASGIILGIAARPFIENLIAGVVISFSRPVRVGDTVIIDNSYGTIEDITITHTVVKIWNWRRYIIPNSRMLSKEIVNCTINDSYQWIHVEFIVAYDSDIQLVKKLAVQTAKASAHFAAYETPRFWIMEMNDKGYTCWVAAWADSPSDAWELANDIRSGLIEQFKGNGILTHKVQIAFPDADGFGAKELKSAMGALHDPLVGSPAASKAK